MNNRFLYYMLKHPVMLLVDRETGVQYLTTLYNQIPLMDQDGNFVMAGLPKLPLELDKTRQKEYGRDLKQRFTFNVKRAGLFRMVYLMTDQQTGVEYLCSGGMVTPLLTETGYLKIKED
ncbi:hypothetical protein [Streptococcus sp. sy004]|uniref:hypothetical protein n=1 Tax=Streptococcus sp. sy004 TaxID=2600149 RepID=UPI0011B5DFBE|nr:hypothetical protein [Streptococcus sp. sy004]TWT09910.1 hypothetical protein FRX54_05685 [Streptococcus sp. sy004]